ncbi:MAG: sulfite dehydrogenase [Gammaproteobacteria bacterium]|nr:sulfite dehydrogenase [Gammaproteobacteria bacterium]
MSENKSERVADNGLINRRKLLELGLGGASIAASSAVLGAEQGLQIPDWSKMPGPGPTAYGQPSPHANLQRLASTPEATYPGGGLSRTPLQHLQGIITPNSLHFERHHAGIPDIDPINHKLVINGMVRQPLVFAYEDLLRYPMVSKVYFIECSGNGNTNTRGVSGGSAQSIHGLVSCAEWTGIPLSSLLDEAGVLPEADWVAAVGADAASMGRSIPIAKAMDDVLVALYQNGEPVRPEQGYPMRLFVPGWEGNISVKWLTQVKLTKVPAQFRDETSKYTDLLPDRRARQFTFPMETKSLITSPSGEMTLPRPGLYKITGIAWSGSGSIRQVEVSADGGQSWADALIESEQWDKALARFSIPWQWEGGEAVLQSRATDSAGNVQQTRQAVIADRGTSAFYHNPGIQSWSVNLQGEVSNIAV